MTGWRIGELLYLRQEDLECYQKHEHTAACHLYGFHDIPLAFATVNAETMSADARKTLMHHKSYATTQRCVNVARQVNRAAERLYVPVRVQRCWGRHV
jgi:hypothetical protein